MPRLGLKPTPKKRYHGGRWRIYWKWNGKQYSIPTNYLDQKKTVLVDSDLRFISAALAMEEPDFPELYAESPAVLQYMLDRYGRNDQSDIPTDPDWIGAYKSTLFSERSKGWATHSIRYLNQLNEFCQLRDKECNRHGGDIRMITGEQAQEFLNSLISAGKSPGTRNRTLSACNCFFKWAIRTNRTRKNPFVGIKTLREEDEEDIIYCTKAERQEIIEMAEASGWPDWYAIPIAFFSGMRREEICRLRWQDVKFPDPKIKSDKGLIIVRKSKTGKRRKIALAPELLDLLSKTPASERVGYVVKMPGDTGNDAKDEVTRPNRLTALKIHLRREKEKRLMAEWQIEKPTLYTGSPRTRSGEEWKNAKIEYRKAKLRYKKDRSRKAEILKIHLERIGWNSFRHTFGSILAQGNVSIDKISSWMGNSPEVCRRHYAEFMPRERHDDDIDKLS